MASGLSLKKVGIGPRKTRMSVPIVKEKMFVSVKLVHVVMDLFSLNKFIPLVGQIMRRKKNFSVSRVLAHLFVY